VIRQEEAGSSGPLHLPAGATQKLLIEVAEALAAADHQEVEAIIMDPQKSTDKSRKNLPAAAKKRTAIMLEPLRLNANQLVQVGNKSLGDNGTTFLCGFVASRAHYLQTVKLMDCSLGDVGAETVAKLVKESGEKLKELNLSSNHIGDRGAAAIAEAMPILDELERLALDRNIIGHEGAEALGKRLARSAIRDLLLGSHLGGNSQIKDKGAAAIAEALDDLMPRRAANRVGRLQHLSLEKCGVSDVGAHAIASKLSKSALVTLSVAGGGMTDAAAIAILKAMPDTMNALDLSANRLTDKAGLTAGDVLARSHSLSMSLAQNHISTGLHKMLQDEHGARLRL
jgi:Ran GTPase-activating protein (RanGAP) involved in mRNA processing and transport